MSELHEVCKTPRGQAVVTIQGGSGALYGFTAFPLEDAPGGAAIYLFARPSPDPLRIATSYWVPLHVGETGGMRDRADARKKRFEAAHRMGATHMLIHFCSRDAEARRKIAHDISMVVGPPQTRRFPQPAAA